MCVKRFIAISKRNNSQVRFHDISINYESIQNSQIRQKTQENSTEPWDRQINVKKLTFDPSGLTPLPSSSTWKRRFSSRMIVPFGGSAHSFSTSGPTQSFKNLMSLKRKNVLKCNLTSRDEQERCCFDDKISSKVAKLPSTRGERFPRSATEITD